ncbi:LIM-domain binding protein-domain-containing protein [Exophiala viscosa]|uniref:LIM-domain binding protein-domain-containing protein n=1 Tax=Exophiala viscosa TaxID=2486360 RepID=A0AAN6DV32_9EURO|nr:LIM-domain binding protein-domain-containing protein [Exophiala viscosa]KAI1623378.1 LIM-domain binding protein-domain-containing protein [Exophiala viscosa]
MMAQPFPAHAGMAPGHPGMPHGHPMAGMQHPGGHMGGQPAPGMMQGMHPGVSGPQVTQGPMVTGMPPGAGTPAPGPMHNGTMAMAHLGPQQAMFQQHNPQMNFGQMQMTPQTQQILARQRMMQMQAQQQQGMPMAMPNGPAGFNQAQLAQMKMNMHPQMQMQMNPNNPHMQNYQQQQHQQRLMQAQQAQAAQHAAQMAAAQSHRAAAQQMQMSRSQEQTTQPPQSQPTPAPQPPAPVQAPPTSQPQQQAPQPKPQPPQAPPQNNQQQSQPSSQPVKTSEPEEEPQIKQQPDLPATMMMADAPKQDFLGGQCILQLIMYQDNLANPERPYELEYWEQTIARYFSQFGSMRQQLFSNKNGVDKSFQLQFPSLARYYHTHFASGVRQILLQSYDHNQNKLPNGGVHIWSTNASLTYVFANDIRVTTTGQLRVIFDEYQKIDHLNISTSGWQEYIPRNALLQSPSLEEKQSPKINKNVKRAQGKAAGVTQPIIPSSGVGEWGVPNHIFQFLEIAEVMTAMGPLMEYFHMHPGVGPKESLIRVTQENAQNMAQVNNARLQNQMARAANGQVPFPNQMNPGMNGPTMMNSPAMGHLAVPQAQGSPMMGGPVHTPSPAQNPAAGGVAMMHQMSAQGSNLSGSQGPSTNTSPNVSNKRRRASAVKMEDDNAVETSGANKVKPSPKIGGKRQKGA